MYNPISTYRIQFHKEFNFNDFSKMADYFQELGIGAVYASPVLQAIPGSMHGYDGVNPHLINPEIGTEQEFRELNAVLKSHKIGWIQDIAPNHMGFHPDNKWLMDLLARGKDSAYSQFFDNSTSGSFFQGRLMVPFLGDLLDEVIKKNELTLVYKKDCFFLKYYEAAFPVKNESYSLICDPEESIEASLERVNQDKSLLKQIADEQYYRLCHWQETDKKINYRRFFTINGLICLNIQNDQVFNEYHSYVFSLIKDGLLDGLRIDHIDGLFDPSGYLERLRNKSGSECYLVVEKILEQDENLPSYWPIQGATGYEFLSQVNNLFTQEHNKTSFTSFYNDLTGDKRTAHEQVPEKKSYILNNLMQGELENLFQLFLRAAQPDNKMSVIDQDKLKETIGQLLIHFPVYRFYGNQMPLKKEEAEAIEKIFYTISDLRPDLNESVSVLKELLLLKPSEGDAESTGWIKQFYQRCMQFSGPLMAKGVEDTLMYTYNRFIGHNEVGDSPERFGLSINNFHRTMEQRQANWPLAMNATSTHDTKRGEDARMRLNVLTEMNEKWFHSVTDWFKMNASLKKNNIPDTNDEYFIYQSLIAAYPMPGEADTDFNDRFTAYLIKAFREAKHHSNWTSPNENYEDGVKEFSTQLLNKERPFWKSFESLHQKIADPGIVNSLAQILLKYTCPGVPDLYQGSELWDLSFVDPDNRRPVDYKTRSQYLHELKENSGNTDLVSQLWEERYNGKLKLWLIRLLLRERKKNTGLFTQGKYIPLSCTGTYSKHVLAFAREHQGCWHFIIIPLFTYLLSEEQPGVKGIDWQDTAVSVPDKFKGSLNHLFYPDMVYSGKTLELSTVFKDIPLAILTGYN